MIWPLSTRRSPCCFRALPLVAVSALVLGLAAAAPPRLAGQEAPGAVIRGVESLMAALQRADQRWRPRVEILPGGGTRYWYRRQPGDAPLTLPEIRRLIADPPSFATERLAIIKLLRALQQQGVVVRLERPRLVGAAGEWDPASRSLRIKPQVVNQGTRAFARVLNHEAIHVAQSCRGGSRGGKPAPLGLSQALPPSQAAVLDQPPYEHASAEQKALEREAYANQQDLTLGPVMLESYCRQC